MLLSGGRQVGLKSGGGWTSRGVQQQRQPHAQRLQHIRQPLPAVQKDISLVGTQPWTHASLSSNRKATATRRDTRCYAATAQPPALPKYGTRRDFLQDSCSLTSTYSPEYVRQRALESPTSVVNVMVRLLDIVVALGIFALRLWVDKLNGKDDEPGIVRQRAAQLRDTLTYLGPSFIKAGQVLANRPDIVREDYMNELCCLQDDVPGFSDELAFSIIEESLGKPIDQVFSRITERPIAAASLGQVYKAVLKDTGEDVAVKVQRPGVEPNIMRDLFIFRTLASFFDDFAQQRLGCRPELIVDEFGEKLMEELDYVQEARNIEEFYQNLKTDPTIKIPWVCRDLCGKKVLVMEWIDGIRCTDPAGIRSSGLDVAGFIRCGVVAGLRQLLEFGLFHGDPHPGNIFAMRDGRIAYVDFGNVAQLSQRNKQTLVDAVVHAVNEDYQSMAEDFIKLGFLSPGTDISPIVPALENIWSDSKGQSLASFNFRTVTSRFNELVYQYPIRIPERYSLVIRSLLTQEGICMTLDPEFHFLEVAYPYVARRLLTDEDPQLRERLFQVLFSDGKFQWKRLENLIILAREGSSSSKSGLDLSDTVSDAVRVLLLDERLRTQLVVRLLCPLLILHVGLLTLPVMTARSRQRKTSLWRWAHGIKELSVGCDDLWPARMLACAGLPRLALHLLDAPPCQRCPLGAVGVACRTYCAAWCSARDAQGSSMHCTPCTCI